MSVWTNKIKTNIKTRDNRVDGNSEKRRKPTWHFCPSHFPLFTPRPSLPCSFIKTTLPPLTFGNQTMQRTAAATDEPRRRSGDAEGEKVFKGSEVFGDTSPNYLKTILALALWLGTIHFNVALVLFAIFFLSLHKALLFVSLSFGFFPSIIHTCIFTRVSLSLCD